MPPIPPGTPQRPTMPVPVRPPRWQPAGSVGAPPPPPPESSGPAGSYGMPANKPPPLPGLDDLGGPRPLPEGFMPPGPTRPPPPPGRGDLGGPRPPMPGPGPGPGDTDGAAAGPAFDPQAWRGEHSSFTSDRGTSPWETGVQNLWSNPGGLRSLLAALPGQADLAAGLGGVQERLAGWRALAGGGQPPAPPPGVVGDPRPPPTAHWRNLKAANGGAGSQQWADFKATQQRSAGQPVPGGAPGDVMGDWQDFKRKHGGFG